VVILRFHAKGSGEYFLSLHRREFISGANQMQWTSPQFEVIALNCEINSLARGLGIPKLRNQIRAHGTIHNQEGTRESIERIKGPALCAIRSAPHFPNAARLCVQRAVDSRADRWPWRNKDR
jgi:hypothetical protein